MIICFASLFGNPCGLHHIKYLESSKAQGDLLIVIVNTDAQVALKGSCPFQDENERLGIVQSLRCVDSAVLSIDKDGGVADTLTDLVSKYNNMYRTFDTMFGAKREITYKFCKGGDRSSRDKLPKNEVEVCDANGIELVFGCGGNEKTGASSSSLSKAFKWYLGQLEKMDKEAKLEYFRKIGI